MLDIRFIRENKSEVEKMLQKRGVKLDLDHVIEIDDERKKLIGEVESLRHTRKEVADKKDIKKGREIKEKLAKAEAALAAVEEELNEYLDKVPNMLDKSVPEGKDENDNVEIKRWGQTPKFDFKPLDHIELGKRLDLIDFERAAKVAGHKFYYLKNDAVLLEFALINYAFKTLLKEGFTPVRPPDLVRPEIANGIGFQPRGPEAQIYNIESENLSLIGTAEIPLGGYHAGEILGEKALPLKYLGFSPCFRTEAGSYGRVSYGLYRVHEFDKAEMFIYCRPEESEKMHQYILSLEEKLFQGLEIPYRIVDICAGDMGAAAARKFDLEAWMPAREGGSFGEVTSTSNTTDYQARRLNIRYRKQKADSSQQLEYVHTLNGTALAIGRTLIAILENYQQKNGSVKIPRVLHEYLEKDTIQRPK
ncbi:MAG: serine--tRNA ligase [Candidatus Woykebacteria bacterium GWB1_45_5]|uniref:Serine--tRNA ligase n=2 Tax=Candidatus Woykeibacteriota TaxID=1817899 RepID=A0A1G1W228_9BACT|nr:MAG: serine--tRNA ligase [Candidatus Woykebacteria bacterium GWA1_44_8]OGY23730.1 MAG: serine--tRNA ligase [Candidatus Woykebacteria bacterium GWB1_45_5]